MAAKAWIGNATGGSVASADAEESTVDWTGAVVSMLLGVGVAAVDAVDAGLGCTLQPWAAVSRYPDAAGRFRLSQIGDAQVRRLNSLCSLSDDELSPAALAARVVLAACAREIVEGGHWPGARLSHHDS